MTTLFNDDDQIEIDETKNYLEELVGEGKKFKTPEDLAKGKYQADMFIQAKNKQYDDLYADYMKLREENTAGSKLQELIDQLKQQQDSSSNNPPNDDDTPAIKTEDIESLISSKLQMHEQTKKEETNFSIVQNKLKEKLGTNFKSILRNQADELGLSEDDVNSLARKNPKLFFKTFDLDVQNTNNFQTPPQNQRRSDNFAPRSEKRTLSFYENLRKTKPDLYYDKKTVIQMDKDAQALGAEFFDV